MALLKACPRCRRLIPQGLPYCPDCKPKAEAERLAAREHREELSRKKYNERYNKRRAADDPKYRQFRNSRDWKQTSRAKLQAASYKCEAGLVGCQRLACEVHHIEPIKTPGGWDRRLDWSNLLAVCTACHNQLDKSGVRRTADPAVLDVAAIAKACKNL